MITNKTASQLKQEYLSLYNDYVADWDKLPQYKQEFYVIEFDMLLQKLEAMIRLMDAIQKGNNDERQKSRDN